ncbi:Hypothetical protein R9X50_00045000 [Acrodontium crateriforme]|uniref:Major facilitator superfamily (MFS) profile domain-containing protein n=1 Tax=Acrodontium crateriforme TaxID=150365 RepID=A0AAQ3M0P2_9PEZI|nr:Hypothetical protein R9X50_00045000 [Acrodontium crateriforme]
MFGHCRDRSLIPVKDLEKYDETELYEESDEEEADNGRENGSHIRTTRRTWNLIMVYLLFLCEAIMASSLSSPIALIAPAPACLSLDASFIRSILDCSYFFGGALGLLWGWTADICGRRRVVLFGLAGMSICCVATTFASGFLAFALLRCVAGAFAAAITVPALAMLADITHESENRPKLVACLPLVAICGRSVPLAAEALFQLVEGSEIDSGAGHSGMIGQIVSIFLVLAIAIAEALSLQETLSQDTNDAAQSGLIQDSEKAAFLGQSFSNRSGESLNSSTGSTTSITRSRISISQMVTVPSVMMLLASFSLLSLHSSTFEVLLPHLGHSEIGNGGMGLPCAWLGLIVTTIKALAAYQVFKAVPSLVAKIGLLPLYRKSSLGFPILYTIVPLAGIAISMAGQMSALSAVIGVIAVWTKTVLSGSAETLILLLVLSAAPDAASTGTVIGVISVSQLFKALAVGISGMSYFISNDYSSIAVNGSLWAALTVTAAIGAAVTWRVRETTRVGADIPEECLVWQGMFDLESEDEANE